MTDIHDEIQRWADEAAAKALDEWNRENMEIYLRRLGELLADNPGEPEDWPDHAKVRLVALALDKDDLERGAVGETQIQDDLRRIADRIEQLGDLWRIY